MLNPEQLKFIFSQLRARFDDVRCSEFEAEEILSQCKSMDLGAWWNSQVSQMESDLSVKPILQ